MKAGPDTDILSALKALIIDTLLVEAEDIKPNSRLVEDLGADAVEAADLFVEIERQWGIEISHESAARLKTVQDMADYIEEHTDA